MLLSEHDVTRYYTLFVPLLHFVNQQRHVVKQFPDVWDRTPIPGEKAKKLCDVLWSDDALREAFIAANPTNLSQRDLDLVASWEHRKQGTFVMLQHRKAYTIFLSEDQPAHAFGVLGLMSSFSEVLGGHVPLFVETVLLPFEGKIIYDGLIIPYAVHFGSGIRADMKRVFKLAEEREGIITSLPFASAKQDPKQARARIHKLLTEFEGDMLMNSVSHEKATQHVKSIAAFAARKQAKNDLLTWTEADLEQYLQQPKADAVSLRRFLTFIRETDRMDYTEATRLLKVLKQMRGEK